MFTQNKAAGNTLGHVEVHPSAVVLNCRIGSGRIGPGTQERKCPWFLLRIVRIEFVIIGCFALDSWVCQFSFVLLFLYPFPAFPHFDLSTHLQNWRGSVLVNVVAPQVNVEQCILVQIQVGVRCADWSVPWFLHVWDSEVKVSSMVPVFGKALDKLTWIMRNLWCLSFVQESTIARLDEWSWETKVTCFDILWLHRSLAQLDKDHHVQGGLLYNAVEQRSSDLPCDAVRADVFMPGGLPPIIQEAVCITWYNLYNLNLFNFLTKFGGGIIS